LWGDDQFTNCVQWCAMIGCLVMCSLLTRQLFAADSANARVRDAQVLSILLVATLPTGLVECISTQTDYVVGFWVASLMSTLLALRQDSANVYYLLAAGFTT